MSVRVLTGDCREVLTTVPAGSVQTCVTSPPYFGLRDYGVDGQIGLEPTVEGYVAELVTVFREVRRVLRDDGTLWLNLGSSYAANWNSRRPEGGGGFIDNGRERVKRSVGFKPKDLIPVPWLVGLALQQDGWWLRSDCIWAKPNCMPSSVRDRPTTSHEYVLLLSKQPRYFFDAEAVKEPNSSPEQLAHNLKYAKPYEVYDERAGDTGQPGNVNNVGIHARPGAEGRNIRSVWTIATAPFAEAHFATFPPALAERCIKAGTSEKGACAACGAPWVRQLEQERGERDDSGRTHSLPEQRNGKHPPPERGWEVLSRTVGWKPSCACGAGDPVPCVVLDPFGGAGTTGLVADRLGRDAVLIELNPAYGELARNRIKGDAPLFAEVAS